MLEVGGGKSLLAKGPQYLPAIICKEPNNLEKLRSSYIWDTLKKRNLAQERLEICSVNSFKDFLRMF